MVDPRLPIRVRGQSGAVIVGVGGELDLATVPRFTQAVSDALAGIVEGDPSRPDGVANHLLILDLLDLGFMDSSGLGAILAIQERFPGVGLKLVVGEGVVERVLLTTAMHKRLDIVSSVSEALS